MNLWQLPEPDAEAFRSRKEDLQFSMTSQKKKNRQRVAFEDLLAVVVVVVVIVQLKLLARNR